MICDSMICDSMICDSIIHDLVVVAAVIHDSMIFYFSIIFKFKIRLYLTVSVSLLNLILLAYFFYLSIFDSHNMAVYQIAPFYYVSFDKSWRLWDLEHQKEILHQVLIYV